jgi:hypothetical protein
MKVCEARRLVEKPSSETGTSLRGSQKKTSYAYIVFRKSRSGAKKVTKEQTADSVILIGRWQASCRKVSGSAFETRSPALGGLGLNIPKRQPRSAAPEQPPAAPDSAGQAAVRPGRPPPRLAPSPPRRTPTRPTDGEVTGGMERIQTQIPSGSIRVRFHCMSSFCDRPRMWSRFACIADAYSVKALRNPVH